MKKGSHNNIEEKMSGGGGNSPSLDMEQFIKMADKEKCPHQYNLLAFG